MNTVTFVTKQIKHIIMEREDVFVMYLISVYFDETTEKRIRGYMKKIEKATGNVLMTQGNIPPHITIAAFQTESEDIVGYKMFVININKDNFRILAVSPLISER